MRSSKRRLGRREFLRSSALATGAVALASCAQPPPSPTAPAEATKPSAPAPTEAAKASEPTRAPVATAAPATPTPAAKSAATTAPTTPTAAAKAAEPKLGANLVGKLEGPEIVRDASKFPKSFKEAPMLAELVKAGKLPPVEKRLPDPGEVLVIRPVQEIGRYGGTWRRAFTGPSDFENGDRLVSLDKILHLDYTGTKNSPAVARDWKISDDGKVMTIYLRKGMKWSDGQPFTADDFVFWYEDLYNNKDLVPVKTPEMFVNGKEGKLEKIDDYTIALKFEEPYYLLEDILGGDTQLGGGQAWRGRFFMGLYAPAHYLKQFHPKYTPKDELDKKVKDAKMDNWVSLIRNRSQWELNPDLPTLGPWKTTTPANNPTWVLERNPYFWAVDTEGNQLPYIDKVQMTLGENLEVINLRAIAGEYDYQDRHMLMDKLPVFLENQAKHGYTVRLDPGNAGASQEIFFNQTYEGDPEIAKWLKNADFRRALSLGIDRDQLVEAFALGLAQPGSVAPSPDSPYSPGAEWRKKWSEYNPKLANEMLDKLGLDKKDSEGFRLRTDGKGRLRLEWITVSAMTNYTAAAEMVASQWKKIGIQADVKETERSLAQTRASANEHQLYTWNNGGSELLYLFPRHAIPVEPTEAYIGPLWAKWYGSGGTAGKKPDDPEMLRAYDLFRSAAGQKLEQRIKTAQEIWKILVDQQYAVGLWGLGMSLRITNNKLGNVPARQCADQNCRTPGSSMPATFFFKS